MKNLCMSVTCADQSCVCCVNSKESLHFHAKKKPNQQTKQQKKPHKYPIWQKLDPCFKLYLNSWWKLWTCLNTVQKKKGFQYGPRYFWTWNPPRYKQWFFKTLFLSDSRAMDCSNVILDGLEAYLPAHSSNPLAWPLLQPQFQTTLQHPCTPCTETNPQGDQAVLLPLVILKLATKRVLKKVLEEP